MADGTDHPATGVGPSSVPTEPGPAGLGANLPPPTETQPYQPVSLQAIGALGVAALYAAIVVIFGLFSMVKRTPYLLPIWTVVLPIAAAGIALIARYRIRRSEGTLSGLPVANWALRLSVVIGIVYGSYYLGTFVFIRWQAQSFAEKWLQTIAAGKTEEAFFETVKPPRKIVKTPDDADDKAALRRTLEVAYNSTSDPTNPNKRGGYSGFAAAEFVQLLQMAGADARIESTGVKDWEYEKGGYTVTLTYRVTTDLASVPIQVKVHGAESPSGEYRGRQWYIVIEETGIEAQTTLEFYTDRGKELRRQAQDAGNRAREWVEALSKGDFEKLYDGTLDAAARKQAPVLHARYLLPRMALGQVPATSPAEQKYLKSRQDFLSGGLVHIDEAVFWAGDRTVREKVEAEARAIFDPTRHKARRFAPHAAVLPLVRRDDSRLRFGFDLTMMDDPVQPTLMFEGRIIVGADLSDISNGKSAPDAWRVEALELVRGRTAAASRPGGGRAPGQ